MTLTEFLWLFVVVGGPTILGIVMAYGMIKQRRLTRVEKEAADRKTKEMYQSEK